MADDYARNALSQRAAFEATHPAAVAAARRFADEPVLRVVDLGAADGVNSHGLIRALAEERGDRPLIYALVDLPTNPWAVAANHLRTAFGADVLVIPAPGEDGPGVADVGTGPHYASPEAHAEGCRRAVDRSPPPPLIVSLAGIPLEQAPSLPPGTVHVAVTGTAMHWVADSGGLASTGSVFPAIPTTSTRPSVVRGASRPHGNGSSWSSCAPSNSRRAAGSSRRSPPPPLRAPTGLASTWSS